MQTTVTVKVPISIEIDVQAWCDEYGVTPGQVRADVAKYVRSLVEAQIDSVGALAKS